MTARLAVARPDGLGRLFIGQVHYQLLLLVRTPRAIVAGVLLPLVLLVVRGNRDSRAMVDLVAGLVSLAVISTAYLTHAAGLVTAREDGVLRRWHATPLPRWCYFAGRIAATVVLAVASTAATVVAGATLYRVSLRIATVVSLLIAVVLGALAVATVGTAATAVIPSTDSAQPLLALSFYPVIILSGVFGSLGDQPRWLTTLVSYLPARPIIDAAAHALRHTSSGLTLMTGHALTVLAAWTGVGLLAAMHLFRWDPHTPAGRGLRQPIIGRADRSSRR